MSNGNIACKDVMRHICESLGEELDSPRCVAIKDHLKGCSDCNEYFASVKSTISLYRHYTVPLSEQSHENLFKTLGLEEFCNKK